MGEALYLAEGSYSAVPVSRSDDDLARHPVRRIAALAIAILLAASVVLSSFTVAGDLHHDCTGDGCVVCAQMSGCLRIARVGSTLAGLGLLALALRILCAERSVGEERPRCSLTTLVAQMVQLND